MTCPACQNKTAPPGMECYLCGPSVRRGQRLSLTEPCAPLCPTCKRALGLLNHECKPHLRLHYKATDSGRPTKFNWEVEYVRGPSKRVRRRSYWHDTSWGALVSAATLWFPDWHMPMARRPYRKRT